MVNFKGIEKKTIYSCNFTSFLYSSFLKMLVISSLFQHMYENIGIIGYCIYSSFSLLLFFSFFSPLYVMKLLLLHIQLEVHWLA